MKTYPGIYRYYKKPEDITIGRMVFSPIDSYGDLMTWEDWVLCVEHGAFIDYDGFGRYSDGDYELRGRDLKPSHLKTGKILTGFSHVVWYNR